jgi:hypothetical protein
MEEMINVGIYVGSALLPKPWGKILYGRPRRRQVDKIIMNIREMGDVDWIQQAYIRISWQHFFNKVMNIQFL